MAQSIKAKRHVTKTKLSLELVCKLYTRYPIVARALGLAAAFRPSARAKESCIQVCKIPLLARRTRPMQPVGQARRATIGYLVYKPGAETVRFEAVTIYCHDFITVMPL